ncbi:MAG: hypothetical protein ABIH76_04810 [Candidatus Bathyarchaeota archaeon]
MFEKIQITDKAIDYIKEKKFGKPSLLIEVDVVSAAVPRLPTIRFAAAAIAYAAVAPGHPPLRVKLGEALKKLEGHINIQTSAKIPVVVPTRLAELLEKVGSTLIISIAGSRKGKKLEASVSPTVDIYIDNKGKMTDIRLHDQPIKKQGYICGYCGIWLAPDSIPDKELKELRKKHLKEKHKSI